MKANNIRFKLDNIVSSENEDNWWRTELFERNVRRRLPKELEIVVPPPAEKANFNCFIYVLGLQNDPQFLGHLGWEFSRTLGGIFDGMIRKEILQRKVRSEKDDLIIYRTSRGIISHAGIMISSEKVLSKWSWGPIIKHSIFDVPNHYGSQTEFYKVTDQVKEFVVKLKKRYPQKIIFFDLYQTLLDVKISSVDPSIKLKEELIGWVPFTEELKKYGITVTANDFLKLYGKRRDDFYTANRDEKFHHHNMQSIIAEVLEKDFNSKRSLDELLNLVYVYRKASRSWLRLYPDVFETLSVLSNEYTLSTASHTQGSFTQLELRELNVEKLFSYFVYSSDIGLRKESLEFYKHALEIVGREAKDCVMIGDNYDVDILVPQKLGFKTIWVKNPLTVSRYAHLFKQETKDTISLKEFAKLPEVIERIFN